MPFRNGLPIRARIALKNPSSVLSAAGCPSLAERDGGTKVCGWDADANVTANITNIITQRGDINHLTHLGRSTVVGFHLNDCSWSKAQQRDDAENDQSTAHQERYYANCFSTPCEKGKTNGCHQQPKQNQEQNHI